MIIDFFVSYGQTANAWRIKKGLPVDVKITTIRTVLESMIKREVISKDSGNRHDGFMFKLLKADYPKHASVQVSERKAQKEATKQHDEDLSKMVTRGAW